MMLLVLSLTVLTSTTLITTSIQLFVIYFLDSNLMDIDMACANGHLDVIKEILKVEKDGQRVANINARNSDGSTPLRNQNIGL